MENISIVWNNAVSEVGGQDNTFNNFQKVQKRFIEIAKNKGISETEIQRECKENYEATKDFFIEV